MTKDINEIREKLVSILNEHANVLKITSDTFEKFEVHGTIETMQGKRKSMVFISLQWSLNLKMLGSIFFQPIHIKLK